MSCIQLCTHTHHSASQRCCSIRCGTKLKVSKSSKGNHKRGFESVWVFFFSLKHVFWGFFFNLPTGISVWPLQESSHSVSTRCFSIILWQPLESPGVVSCWKVTFKYPVYNIWMVIEIAASWVVSYNLKKKHARKTKCFHLTQIFPFIMTQYSTTGLTNAFLLQVLHTSLKAQAQRWPSCWAEA